MASIERAVKRNSIAVFEHVVKKRKKPEKRFRPNRFLDDSSASESELVIDDSPVNTSSPPAGGKKNRQIRLTEEPLTLICYFDDCRSSFQNFDEYNIHLKAHVDHYCTQSLEEDLTCQWDNCGCSVAATYFWQHVAYHGYMIKLINIGNNVLFRHSLPDCSDSPNLQVPLCVDGYYCDWEDCVNPQYSSIYDFLLHIQHHVKNNPKLAGKGDFIECKWKGCRSKFPSQYKLADHIRVHTKERIIACPTCFTLFSSKTKFRDHRKRQLPLDLQCYQCSQCLKLFASERLLRDHMRSHINHYKCTMCDMTCPKPSNLAKHIRYKHLKDKPFKCETCSKTFTSDHNLKMHLRTHQKDLYLYNCQSCRFKCKSAYGLDRHFVKMHNQKMTIYECHCCKETFQRGGYLTKHLMKIHNYHWPSGHSRFKYRQDQDGIFRLQTVRYESLEVTEEMIRSESMQHATSSKTIDTTDSVIQSTNKNVLITIEDIDDDGNVLKSEVIESNELILEDVKVQGRGEETVDDPDSNSEQEEVETKWSIPKSLEPIESNNESIRYFSKDVILNYDKFQIVDAKK